MRELDCGVVTDAAGLEAGGHERNHPRHSDDGQQHQRHQDRELDGLRLLGKGLGRRAPLPLQGPREHGHEAGIEGALGEQPAQEVRQLEGDEEGVRERAGAEQPRDQDVPDEAQEARDERERSDRGDRADQRGGTRRRRRRTDFSGQRLRPDLALAQALARRRPWASGWR